MMMMMMIFGGWAPGGHHVGAPAHISVWAGVLYIYRSSDSAFPCTHAVNIQGELSVSMTARQVILHSCDSFVNQMTAG